MRITVATMSCAPDSLVRSLSTPDVAPAIYALSPVPRRLDWTGRLIAAGIWTACSALLVMAAIATPSPTGVGTHELLGLQKCGWLETYGYPCPTCGMTTSFSWFVRGHLLASVYVQPMGFLLAILTGMAWWASLYIAATGRPAYRLLDGVPTAWLVLAPGVVFAAAWGWKIAIHQTGHDGWR